MGLKEYIHPELIATDIACGSSDEALACLAELLRGKGYVRESYAEAVISREKEFPTGLACEHINVAIPHADAEHVIKPALAVGKLQNSVDFVYMDNENETVPVDYVFMMAITQPEKQLAALREMMKLFQNKQFVEQLTRSETGGDVYRALEAAVGAS